MITDDSNAVTWFKSIFRIPMKPKFKITAADNGITAKIPQPRCLKNIAAIKVMTTIDTQILITDDLITNSTISRSTTS